MFAKTGSGQTYHGREILNKHGVGFCVRRERHIIQVHYGNRWTDNRRKYSDPNGSGESYDVFFPVDPAIFAAANPRQRRIIGCHGGGPFG